MSLLDASQQLMLSNLRNQREPKLEGIRDWILSSSYRLEQSPRKKNVGLLVDTSTDFVEAIAFDIGRYSSAAIETMQQIKAAEGKLYASGWIVIRAYYSSYFAANTLMRLFGHFCTNLEQRHIAAIHEMASLYEVPLPVSDKSRLSPGTYAGRYSARDGSVVLRSLHGVGGGAHKQFWFAFKEFLDAFDRDIGDCSLSKIQRTEARTSIRALLVALCQKNHPNGNWLSEIRNAVNYRLEYGAWHPYANSEILAEDLVETILEAFSNPPRFRTTDVEAHDILRSMDCCSYVFSWMLSSLKQLSGFSKGGPLHFLQIGPFALFV